MPTVDLLRTLLYGVSAQRPGHTLSIGGQTLPLEARMGGLFLGFLSGLLFLAVQRRLRASSLPPRHLLFVCGLLVAITGADGLNAFLFDGDLPHLYSPNLTLRLLTGLGAGLGIALVAVPVEAAIVWAEPRAEPSLRTAAELIVCLGASLALGTLILADVSALLWPVALVMAVAVVVAFAFGSLHLLALGSRWARYAHTPADVAGPASVAFGLALLELAALAVLRSALASFGWSA